MPQAFYLIGILPILRPLLDDTSNIQFLSLSRENIIWATVPIDPTPPSSLSVSMSHRYQPFEPPSVSELQEFLLADRQPTGHLNQVWPHLYIGNEYVPIQALDLLWCIYVWVVFVFLLCRLAARDKGMLQSLGITHIVNAAHRPSNVPQHGLYVNTGPRFYRDMKVDYYGVEADDASNFMLSPFFYPTARFIRAGLAQGGKSPNCISLC